MTELRCETLTIPGAALGGENPLPFFRDPAVNLDFKVREPFPAEKRAYMGWETAFRVLPYRMQDQYSRDRQPLAFRSIVLENEFLKATFLPEMGGRLISLVEKPDGRELLHRNPVFQPANLAIRNAWFSGGIEWNIAQFGHTFTTCAPLFAAQILGAQGEPGLRLYEYERCKGVFWQIDFYLPPGFQFLIAYTRIVNSQDREVPMYWWTNAAVDERPGVRILAPAREAIYGEFDSGGAAFGMTGMPGLPSLKGEDGTYSLNSTFANEFFFQCEGGMPWEAALDEQGKGFVEASTGRLRYRKLFCWGTHAGGRHWQEFLSQPGEAYLEIQAGLAPTQVHGLPMPAQTTWDWTQVFGSVQVDPRKVHGQDWAMAVREVETALQGPLPQDLLETIELNCRMRADQPCGEALQNASGWGALEKIRRARAKVSVALPAGLSFPEAQLGEEQEKWLALIATGELTEQHPGELPGEWMVQDEWYNLLKESRQNWYSLLHLGVMKLERLDEGGAEAAWLASVAMAPSAWAYRNLAILALRRKDLNQARVFYEKAWECALQSGHPHTALAIEYMEKLAENGQWAAGMAVYQALTPEMQLFDRAQILRGRFAMALGDLASVEEVLRREYAVIREGETTLTDLWFELHARRTGCSLEEARTLYPPPPGIDFRSFNG